MRFKFLSNSTSNAICFGLSLALIVATSKAATAEETQFRVGYPQTWNWLAQFGSGGSASEFEEEEDDKENLFDNEYADHDENGGIFGNEQWDELRDREDDELEIRHQRLKAEHVYSDVYLKRMEMLRVVAQFADDHLLSATYAISQSPEMFEDRRDLAEFLEDLLEETDHTPVERMLRMKLVEVYTDLGDKRKAKSHLKAVIVGK